MSENTLPPDDLLDQTIAGRYRIISRLGAGGMGVAYRAWDENAEVPVVIKIPKKVFLEDPKFVERFNREIRLLQGLTNPHIVPIVDVGEHDGLPYVVMRFLPGGSLSDRRLRDDARKPRPNPPGMLHLWLPAIAEALDYVHDNGVVHRDVKPGNIFFDAFWGAFLGDFGIAKVVEESETFDREQTLTATHMGIGTQEYMAPEQFTPKAVIDGRADQYALAVMVYEILAGTRPFTGTTAHLIIEVTSRPAPRLDGLVSGLPRSLIDAVHRGLTKNPQERFSTCQEFAYHVLQKVPVLADEPDIARLLCPNCSNILKLPVSARGQKGKCPKCETQMKVADDLGALWLLDEAQRQRRAAGMVDNNRFHPDPESAVDGTASNTEEEPLEAFKPISSVTLTEKAMRNCRLPSRSTGTIAGGIVAALLLTMLLSGLWPGKLPTPVTDTDEAVVECEDLNSLTTLDAGTAKALAMFRGYSLELNGLTTLDADRAKVLARFQGSSLDLAGLPTLDADTAKALAEFRGHHLRLNGLTALNAETAIALAGATAWNGELPKVTTLDVDTAKALAGFQGQVLGLRGLKTLDVETAEALAEFKGKRLGLGGLKTLDVDTAKALARYAGELSLPYAAVREFLETHPFDKNTALAVAALLNGRLDSLTTLDVDTANALAEFRGRHLFLNGLTALDAETAIALAGATAWNGELPKVTTLDVDTAKALAGFQGRRLDLAGLTTLAADTARALAEFKGQVLGLRGLKMLDVHTAKALAGYAGELSLPYAAVQEFRLTHPFDKNTALAVAALLNGRLDSLTTLDAATAKALAEFKGQSLYLNGLQTLGAEAAKALAKSKAWNGHLRNLTTLDVDTAKALAGFQGRLLDLGGLTTLDADTAKALAEFKGQVLSLDGLKMLSDEAADVLRSHQPPISLPLRFRR